MIILIGVIPIKMMNIIDSACKGTSEVMGVEKKYFVLEKERHLMAGKAFYCIKEKNTIETSITWYGRQTSTTSRSFILLSREECIAMHLSKGVSDKKL